MRRQWDGASSSILQQEAPTPRVEILHNRKGMPRHQSCHTYVPCLSLGKEVHHSDRTPCIGVAGPSKGQQCPPHPVEPSTAAIPVCCPISSWLCQQQCRWTVSSFRRRPHDFIAREGGRSVKDFATSNFLYGIRVLTVLVTLRLTY